MTGTSSSRAGRIWKFSGGFTLMLIVHHTRTDATSADASMRSAVARISKFVPGRVRRGRPAGSAIPVCVRRQRCLLIKAWGSAPGKKPFPQISAVSAAQLRRSSQSHTQRSPKSTPCV
jgi:hypothetical protein